MRVDNKAMMQSSKRQRERKTIEQAKYGTRLDRREDGLIKSKRMRQLEAAIDARAPKSVGKRTMRGKV